MKNPQLLQHGSVARRLHFWSLLILTLLMLSGCVRGEILIDISQDYSGHLTATLGIDRSLLSMARGSGQDPFETLIGDDLPSDVRVERWAEGDYEWMRGERSFNNLAELEYMLTDGVFEEVEVSVQDRKFMLRGRTRAMEGEPDEPMSQMAAGVINFRLFIKAPGETIETNGIFDRDLGAYSWNIRGDRHRSDQQSANFAADLVGARRCCGVVYCSGSKYRDIVDAAGSEGTDPFHISEPTLTQS
jgi:hypothetical protein